MENKKIIESVNNYYTEKVNEHGPTPKGVDWNGIESQKLRFKVLLGVVANKEQRFSVLDYGCGYGAMYEYMNENFSDFSYTGYDISEAMITEASKLHNADNAVWQMQELKLIPCDYVVASGIFNVRLNNTEIEWEKYILETLHKIDALSTKGFSFNMLTSYSDKEYMKDYLHYANPSAIFEYCRKNFSKYVALLHDYPLYEFSIVVRKSV